ncbi:MAG: hypothetical protein LUI10_04490 [Lachnospiraceae bacterium]|nr:hypothetical protein [Lachnospiraceae bacterium]
MNLKEAFRFQNKLQALSDEVNAILGEEKNVVTVKNTYLRKKVMPEAEDETVIAETENDYSGRITDLTVFLIELLKEREKLSAAIRKAKESLPIDMDSEVSLNSKRQETVRTLREMDSIRSSETVISNGGTGYQFNAEGNQVTYRCDVKRVTTINFDRNVVRKYIRELDRKADAVSAQIDQCLVNSTVDYEAPFDVNDSLYTIFEGFAPET